MRFTLKVRYPVNSGGIFIKRYFTAPLRLEIDSLQSCFLRDLFDHLLYILLDIFNLDSIFKKKTQ